MAKEADPLGIYIHWPYCLAKCPYCDFNSHVTDTAPDQTRWKRALVRELESLAERVSNRRAESIFFGGGTPSLMAPDTVAELVSRIQDFWPSSTGLEITLEANPTSSEAGRFRAFADAGVNRLSLGIQALNDKDLKRLGRRHTADEAMEALEMGQAVFSRLSFDLIYARTGQTVQDWERELAAALDFAKGHLSLYQLTIEKGTAFYQAARDGRMQLPEDGAADKLYKITQKLCEAAGLPAYEISNHAAPGEESVHNLNYWRGGDYIGIGPGAHSRLGGHALETERNPVAWLSQVEKLENGLISDEKLTRLEIAEERLLMGLRLREGVDLGNLARCTGYGVADNLIEGYVNDGFLQLNDNRLRVTSCGRFVLNRLIGELASSLSPVN